MGDEAGVFEPRLQRAGESRSLPRTPIADSCQLEPPQSGSGGSGGGGSDGLARRSAARSTDRDGELPRLDNSGLGATDEQHKVRHQRDLELVQNRDWPVPARLLLQHPKLLDRPD